jgi:hypothetical protein
MTARVQKKKNSGHESQGAWRKEELIGSKPLVLQCMLYQFFF